MVVETWKNIPTAVANSQESDTEETSKTHCPKRIPNLNRIKQFSTRFESSKVYYFGSYFWVIFPLKFLLGRSSAFRINQILEKIKPSGSGAFKFIFVGQKLTPQTN